MHLRPGPAPMVLDTKPGARGAGRGEAIHPDPGSHRDAVTLQGGGAGCSRRGGRRRLWWW